MRDWDYRPEQTVDENLCDYGKHPRPCPYRFGSDCRALSHHALLRSRADPTAAGHRGAAQGVNGRRGYVRMREPDDRCVRKMWGKADKNTMAGRTRLIFLVSEAAYDRGIVCPVLNHVGL